MTRFPRSKRPLLILVLIAAGLGWVWQRFNLKAAVVRQVIQRLESTGEIRIASLDFAWDADAFAKGEVRGLQVSGVHLASQTRFELSGSLKTSLSLDKVKTFSLDWSDIDVTVTMERLRLRDGWVSTLRSDEGPGLSLSGQTEFHSHENRGEGRAELSIAPFSTALAEWKASAGKTRLALDLNGERLKLALSTPELKAHPEGVAPDDESTRLLKLELSGELARHPTELFSVTAGALDLSAQRMEWLKGMDFLVLEKQDLGIHARYSRSPHRASLEIPLAKLALDVELSENPPVVLKEGRVRIRDLALPGLLAKLKSIPSLEALTALGWDDGRLSAEARFDLESLKRPERILETLSVNLAKLTFKDAQRKLALQEGEFALRYRGVGRPSELTLFFPRIVHHSLESSIPRQTLRFTALKDRVELRSGTDFTVQIAEKKMRMKEAKGYFDAQGPHLEFALDSEAIPLRALSKGYCMSFPRPLPGAFRMDVRKVEWGPDEIHVFGESKVELFGGSAKVYGIAIFDYGEEVPEVQFDAEWEGLDLEKVGYWMNFGKMDGKIQGYMKEAVLQASLPTQYDFRLELAPKKGDRIEFSPQAMRNFIRTFAGESIDRIPGIVNWIAFGWPAQFLGFFNIEYAGIALLSKDGFIQVKTLKEGEPYVLKGFRIKVPLKAPRTPLIVDAYAMGQFVSQLKQRLMNLSEEGASAGAEPQFLIDGADRQGALKSRQSDGSCFTPGF